MLHSVMKSLVETENMNLNVSFFHNNHKYLLGTYNVPGAFLVAQTGKNMPAMWETQVRSVSWEGPLEKRMAAHSSVLAWRIPWTEESGRIQSMGPQRVRLD